MEQALVVGVSPGMTIRDEPLSLVDAAWLQMDRPTNLMVINAVIELAEPLTLTALEQLTRERLLRHRRFVQRVTQRRLGWPRWSVDPSFALERHVRKVELPPPGDAGALRALVGELASTPLDRAHPLWQQHLVEHYGSGSAVIVRLHHCIADGVALVRLLLSLTEHAQAEVRAVGITATPPRGRADALRRVVKSGASLWRMLTLPNDPRTALDGRLGTDKHVGWSQAGDLAEVRAAARRAGATVTDVLLAAVTGALRRHLEASGEAIPQAEIRALVPVNLRRVVGGDQAGNRFGLAYLTLPLLATTPRERLDETQRRMAELKSSPDALVAFGVLGVMGLLRATVERLGVELFTRKATVMVTSLPGPPEPVQLAGRSVRDLIVWAPSSGEMAMSLSMFSYANEVRLGVAADARVVPDPQAIADRFDEELRATCASV